MSDIHRKIVIDFLSSQTEDSNAAVVHAIEGGLPHSLRLLLSLISNKDPQWLFPACRVSVQICRIVLDLVDPPTEIKNRALQIAFSQNRFPTVELLLSSGADASINNNYFLFESVRRGSLYLTQLFIQYGADIYVQDQALIRIAQENYQIAILKFLILNGPKFDIRTTLRFACERGFTELVEVILKIHTCEIKRNLVDAAFHNGYTSIVRLLLEAGGQVVWCDLLHPINEGRNAMVETLLQFGANPNTDDGQPLILAVQKRNYEVIEMLLKAGANPRARQSQAVAKVLRSQDIPTLRILMKYGIKLDDLRTFHRVSGRYK